MTTTVEQPRTTTINGLDTEKLRQLVSDVERDPAKGMTRWSVSTRWIEGTVSRSQVTAYEIGGKRVAKNFSILVDEPLELGGTNQQPNPQEYLLTALNACMTVGYVAAASLMGVELQSLEIESEGEIDLRGFLGLDPDVKPGYDEIHYIVRIKGNGTPEQFRQIHEIVKATSPNRFNITRPITVTSELVVN
jgi:uncharacterized OsmC-like protein